MDKYRRILRQVINEMSNRRLLNEITIRDKYEKEKTKTKWSNPRDFQRICQSDPTYNREKDIVGKYTNWLLLRLKDLSDLERVRVPLEWYTDGMKRGILQRQGISPDINAYKSVDDFINAMQSVMKSGDELMQSASEMNNREKFAGQFKVIGQSRYWEVISPLTFEAERWFGRKTEWCTVANEDYFVKYGGYDGELFIFYPRDGKLETRIQVHFDSESYFDVNDNGYDDITEALISHNSDEDSVADGVNLANELWNLNLKYIKFSEVPELLAQGVDPKEIFDNDFYFSDGFAGVELNGKWNFINTKGQLLSPLWLDLVCDFENGFADVRLNGKWNFINTKGQIIYKPNEPDHWFDRALPFDGGFAGVKLNGKWNFINTKGQIIYKPNEPDHWFEQVGHFSGGFGGFVLNNKQNFIDTEGHILYKPNEPDKWFDEISPFFNSPAKVNLNGVDYRLRSDGVLCDYRTLQPIPELNESRNYRRILRQVLNEELSKKEVEDIVINELDKKFKSRDFERLINGITADAMSEFFDRLWMKKQFIKDCIKN